MLAMLQGASKAARVSAANRRKCEIVLIFSGAQIRGLPYRCSPAEILAFFEGYQYMPDSLQIGLDSAGRPSGEAWLTFNSPEEGKLRLTASFVLQWLRQPQDAIQVPLRLSSR